MVTGTKQLIKCVLLALCVLYYPAVSMATCSQDNIVGTWHTYGISGGNEIDRCKVKINSSGSIVGSASSCSARDASGRFSLNIGGGSVNVSNACTITGKIRFCEAGNCVSSKIEHGKLERDHNVLTIEGYLIPQPNAVFSMVGIKK